MKHNTEGLKRPCTASDLFSVTGGLQCGNCGAHNVPKDNRVMCSDHASDGPCPLVADGKDGICWVHRIQRTGHPTEAI